MSITKSTYSSAKIAQLRQLLYNNKEAGKSIDYEIRIDDLKVVARTSDPDLFDNHEDFIADDTRSIHIILYEGSSRNNSRYIFSLKEETSSPTLSGMEMDKLLNDKLSQERKQWKQELLEKENQELKSKITEAEEYITKLHEALELVKTKRMKLGDVHWGEIASVAMEGLIRRNTHLLSKIPGAEALAGIIEKDNTAKELPQVETEVSFKKAESKETEPINEEEKELLGFLKQLQERFKEEELAKIITLLNLFVDKPLSIEPTIQFVSQWKDVKPNKKEEANSFENPKTSDTESVNTSNKN